MHIINFFNTHTTIFLTMVGILGLCVGSFLNVVIYRLPIMLHQAWRAECLDFLEQPTQVQPHAITLNKPRSHCPNCNKQIPFWHNIPILSYLLLRGKCAYCKARISPRYLFVELGTAVLAIFIAYEFGASWPMLAVQIFTASLIALFFIDISHQLLPDDITLSLLWLGLFCNIWGTFTDLQSAVIGALAGYLSLWIVAFLFKKLRKKDGMGHGDFKLFAALGAWLGWQVLPFIILLASVCGAIIGVSFLIMNKNKPDTPMPFGPMLALAGWIAMFWGGQLITLYMQLYSF